MKKERFGMVLPITLLSFFLILMDNSIIFTSSVQIGESLGLSDSSLAWVSNAYTLTFGGFLLLSGRLSDFIGRKRIFQIGLAIFGLSSLVIGLSTGPVVIIIARAIQGIGSSIIAPTTLALMMDAYSGEQRTKAISYYGATAGIGGSIGLLLGGGLTSFVSWRAGFLINVPLTILLMFLAQKYIKSYEGQKSKIDYVGSLLSVVGLASFIYGLDARSYGSFFVVAGLVILVVFYFYERGRENAIMPLELFKSKVRFGAYLARMFFMMSILSYWFLLPQSLQRVYGYDAFQSGLAFIPISITTFLAAFSLPRLTKRLGNNRVLLIGEVVLLLGLLWAALTPLESGYLLAVGLPMLVIGAGQGLIVAPATSAGIYKTSDSLAGAASGLTNAMHQIGGPIGLSIIISLTTSLQYSLYLMVLFAIFGLVVVYTLVYRTAKNK